MTYKVLSVLPLFLTDLISKSSLCSSHTCLLPVPPTHSHHRAFAPALPCALECPFPQISTRLTSLSPPGLVSNVIFSMRPSLIPLFKIITPSWHPVSFPALILSPYLIRYTSLFFPLFSPILYFPPSMKGSAPWRREFCLFYSFM